MRLLPRKRKRKKRGSSQDVESHPEDGDATRDEESTLELTHVGSYKIVAPIGSGGMGTVYKAIDPARDSTVAIKVLYRQYDLDPKRRKRDYLGREILIAAELKHDCIIRMHDKLVEQEDSEGNVRRCLLMEYIDGHNLRKHITDRDLTVPQMTELCIRLCHGLDFLHQNGIVHRDIKPENFLFSRDLKQVKIVDFGLAKSTSSWRTRWIRERGGTRRYMSPEQLSKKPLDARSDIFSFGITLYELFTGQHPCNGKDSTEIMRQIRSSRYRSPSRYGSSWGSSSTSPSTSQTSLEAP